MNINASMGGQAASWVEAASDQLDITDGAACRLWGIRASTGFDGGTVQVQAHNADDAEGSVFFQLTATDQKNHQQRFFYPGGVLFENGLSLAIVALAEVGHRGAVLYTLEP